MTVVRKILVCVAIPAWTADEMGNVGAVVIVLPIDSVEKGNNEVGVEVAATTVG